MKTQMDSNEQALQTQLTYVYGEIAAWDFNHAYYRCLLSDLSSNLGKIAFTFKVKGFEVWAKRLILFNVV